VVASVSGLNVSDKIRIAFKDGQADASVTDINSHKED